MSRSYRQPRIYFASKLHHAAKVMQLAHAHPQLHFTARWPLMFGKVADTPEFAPQFWQDDFDDIWRSDAVLVWGEPQDRLRGALVEAGIAIGMRKIVVLAGKHADFGTWQFHPMCNRMDSLEEALEFCKTIRPFERP